MINMEHFHGGGLPWSGESHNLHILHIDLGIGDVIDANIVDHSDMIYWILDQRSSNLCKFSDPPPLYAFWGKMISSTRCFCPWPLARCFISSTSTYTWMSGVRWLRLGPRTVAVHIADILHQQVHFTYLWRLFLLLRESDSEVMKRISGKSKDEFEWTIYWWKNKWKE